MNEQIVQTPVGGLRGRLGIVNVQRKKTQSETPDGSQKAGISRSIGVLNTAFSNPY